MNNATQDPGFDASSWLTLQWTRGTRYYRVHLEQDLWSSWVLTSATNEVVRPSVVHVASPRPPSTLPATLTDVLIASIRLAKRQQNMHDTTSLSAGGALARLNLPIEACMELIAKANEDIRALQRALRPELPSPTPPVKR